jgi:[ribosomal protein S5]-alanine N-acetyltransferase
MTEGIQAPRGLSDGVVAIRPLVVADAPAFAGAFKDDPSLGVMLGSESDPTEEEIERQAQEEAVAGRVPALAIADADGLEFLGGIGLYRIDTRHRRGEVGFWLTRGARGKGLGARAVSLVTGWAFDSLGFERVELTTTPDNAATLALARKLGFTHEGVMRERNLERGRRVDVVMLAVLARDWRG